MLETSQATVLEFVVHHTAAVGLSLSVSAPKNIVCNGVLSSRIQVSIKRPTPCIVARNVLQLQRVDRSIEIRKIRPSVSDSTDDGPALR